MCCIQGVEDMRFNYHGNCSCMLLLNNSSYTLLPRLFFVARLLISQTVIVTHENFVLKLSARNYVRKVLQHAKFGSNRYCGGLSPNRRDITLLSMCLPFSNSVTRPCRSAGPIFTLYGRNDVFPRKKVPFGG